MEFARLSPPPIEEASGGLSQEEVRLLLAPPAGKVESAEALSEDAEPVSSESSRSETRKPAVMRGSLDDDDHIHDDEEAERAANAARGVS